MSKGSRQRARFNTGIRMRQMFYPFIKNTLQSILRSKLHVEIKTSPAEPEQFIEILLVECGENPRFEEAKVLIGKTIKMTEENWEDLKVKSCANMNSEESQPIELDDSIEELSSNDDSEDILKEKTYKKDSPRTAVVCGSSGTDGLCTVVIDSSGGPVSTNNRFPEVVVAKDKINEKNSISCNKRKRDENVVDSSDSTSKNSMNTLSGTKISIEDFIFLKSRSGKISKDDTIVLDDETILISSGSESEEDILIDKVVQAVPVISKKKRKTRETRFSDAMSSTTPLTPALNSKKKRKCKVSVSPGQGNHKIIKTTMQSGISSRRKAAVSLQIKSLHEKITKFQQQQKINNSLGNIPSTSAKYNFANNVISSSDQTEKKTGLRPVVIDANNVSRFGKVFHLDKLETCIKYFKDRNHKVIAFLPRNMLGVVQANEVRARLWMLEEEKVLCFTPSRRLPDGTSIAAYDDRFIVQTATELGGVIVSNDNFRDIMDENERWKETIEKRLLMFTWVGNMLMFPNDPLGRGGPHLEEFLRFPEEGE